MLAYEYDHWLRQIWIGEEHPKDLDLSWMGNSVGKWEDDTLVVDTISMRSEPWFDTAGRVFSADLHIVERFGVPTMSCWRLSSRSKIRRRS
jgi:hypothetical protein